MKKLRLNLHRRVLLTLLGVGLIPAAVGVALTAREMYTIIRNVAGDNLVSEARSVAALLDREINRFIALAATTAAADPDVADLFGQPQAADAASTLAIALSPLWDDSETSRAIFLLPRIGPLQVFVWPPAAAPLYRASAPPYRFLEERRRDFTPGLMAASVHTDSILGRSVALIWIPVPSSRPENFRGWLGVEVSLASILREESARALYDVQGVCVISSMGHLIGQLRFRRERAAEIYRNLSLYAPAIEGRFETRFGDGSRQMIAFSALPITRVLRRYMRSDADWYVCVGLDPRSLTAAFRAQLSRNLIGGLVLSALLCILAYGFARRLTRPIQQLEEGVRRVAGGDLESRVEVRTGDELEALAKAFNEMADRIEQAARDVREQMATVRRQADELALLHEVSRAINARLDLDQTLQTFARETTRVISYDHLSVALLDEDGHHFTVQFVFPESGVSEFGPGTRHYLEETDVGDAVREGRPVVRRNIGVPPRRAIDESFAAAGLRTVMVVPLISQSRAIGSVNLASSDPNAFGPEEQERLAVLAESVAVAIQHSRLYMRVRRFAEDLEEEVRRRTAQLRLAQDKLVQTEKLAATGQMAAGIAHEINNPLGIIKNYLRLAADKLRYAAPGEVGATLSQHLQVIEEEISRIARIVRNLLDLYHPREYSPTPIDLHDLLDRVLELFAASWKKKGIEIVRNPAPTLPPLIVSADRMRQVFINLLRNAEDAIEGTGRITITTRVEPAAGDVAGEQVIIEVADTGCGIPKKALPRVFDPFFTTKKGGAGTGLGLSVTYGIIRSYGGTIDIDSEPGQGTCVTITLPLVSPAAASAAAPSATGEQ